MSLSRQSVNASCLSKPLSSPQAEEEKLFSPSKSFWVLLLLALILPFYGFSHSRNTVYTDLPAYSTLSQAEEDLAADTYGIGVLQANWYHLLQRVHQQPTTALLASSIGDFVWLDCDQDGIQDVDEVGIPDVPVSLVGTDVFGDPVDLTEVTNQFGNYTFIGLNAGIYTITFGVPLATTGLAFTQAEEGTDIDLDSNADPTTGSTGLFTLENNKTETNIDAGFIDVGAPVLNGIPADTEASCDAIPAPPVIYTDITATDNWNTNSTITLSTSSTQGTTGECSLYNYLIIRTWTVDDDCGNSNAEVQIITVKDSDKPQLEGVPEDITVDPAQGEVIPPVASVSATDICDPSPTVTVEEDDIPTTCGFIRVRTWTAEDACGNQTEEQQNITVLGQTASATASSNSPVCGGDDLLLFADGGTSYSWTGPGGFSSTDQNPVIPNASPLNAGNYTVVVSDGTCTETLVVTVAASAELVANPTVIDATCTSLGRIILSISGGSSPFTFDWADLPGGNDPFDRDDLAPGTYNVIVTDANNCTLSEAVTVADNCACTANAGTISAEAALYCVSGSQLIAAVPDGNALVPAGYSTIYVLTSGTGLLIEQVNTIPQFVVTSEGQYTIHTLVFDPLTLDLSIVVAGVTTGFEVNALLIQGGGSICGSLDVAGAPISVASVSASVSSTTPASCGLADGTATLTPASNTYNWSDGGFGATRSDLPAGTYTVAVSNAQGCTTSLQVSIADNCNCEAPEVTDVLTFGTVCGQDDGIATINVVGDPAAFIFEWLPNNGIPNATNNSRSGLAAGVYNVKISNPAFSDCFTEIAFVIGNNDGPGVTSINTTPATCDLANGMATILPDFNSYVWSIDNVTASSRSDLAAGVYEVVVFDQSSPPCPSVILVEILAENPLQVSPVVNSQPDCQQANGSVTLSVSGGSGNYTYSWGPGETRNDLAAGVYTVTVSDNTQGCERELTFTLSNNVAGASITIDPVVSTTCSGADDAQANFTVAFDPTFVGPGDTLLSDGTNTYSPNDLLTPGDYCLLINDANGCLAAQSCFAVVEPEPIVVDVNLTDKDCNQAGTISLDVSGGNGGYTFDWNDLGGNNDPQNRTDLQAGIYGLEIMDANGCSRTISGLTIEDTCPFSCVDPLVLNTLVVEATCGEANGGITLEVMGNPSQYNYTWLPDLGFGNENVKTALPAGVYEVTITNAVDPSCTTNITIVISNSDGPQVDISSVSPAFCNQSNGAALVGPAGLIFEWCNGVVGFNPTNLPGGICPLMVTDPATGCTNVVEVEIPTLNVLEANPIISQQPDCNQANGVVDLQILGGSTNYDIQWSDGGLGAPRTGLAAGVYTVTVTDLGPSGCVAITTFALTDIVDPGATLTLQSASPIELDCVDDNNGQVDFSVNYEAGFAFPADTVITDGTNVYPNGQLGAGSYCVLIRDAAGCLAAEACFEVEAPEPIEIVVAISQQTCTDLGAVQIMVSGGSGLYTFDWADVPGNNDPLNRNDLTAGVYQLTVNDLNGCQAVAQNLIVVDECLDCPNAETIGEIIPTNTQDINCFQLEACFDPQLTNYVLLDGGLSGSSGLGSWTLGTDGCLQYTSGNTPGLDTVCVLAQFGTLTDTVCYVYEIFEIPLNAPITDTIYLTTLEGNPVDSCLTLAELGGVFTSSSVFLLPVNGTGDLTITDNCVTYNPNPGSLGNFIDTMIVVICNDLIPVCDTTVIIVSVEPLPNCPDHFGVQPDTLKLTALSCDTTASFCLDSISPFAMQFYTLLDNGVEINPPFPGCNVDTLFDYDLDQILSVDPLGPWELVNWIVNADTFALANFADFADLVDSMNIWDPLGGWTLEGNNIVGGFVGNVYSDLDVESLITSTMDPIPLDPLFTARGSLVQVDTGFHELILILDSTACADTLLVQVDCNTCPEIYAGPDTLMADSCQGFARLCLDISPADLLDYTITDNGDLFTGDFEPCVIDTAYQYVAFPLGSPGIYELLSWEVNGISFSIPLFTTVDQLADSIKVWDPAGNWELFGFVIVGGAPGSTYSDLIVSVAGNPPLNIPAQVINDATAVLLEPGSHQLELLNNRSLCEYLLDIEVVCDTMDTPILVDTILNVFVGDSDTLCFDNLLPIISIDNLCPDANDGNVFIDLIAGTNCIEYSGILLGQDTFCLVLCDGVICDTTTIQINVLPVIETIPLYINVGITDTFCLDTTIFQNPIDTFYNFCEIASGTFVDVALIDGTVCVEYTGLAVGNEPACLVLCDTAGFCDTTFLDITVVMPIVEIIDTTVLLGDFDTICLDPGELVGSVDSFYNFCDRGSGLFVEFYLDKDSLCVIYEGVAVGTDSACLVLCDEFGICDTTFLYVTTIIQPDTLPIAVNDTSMTMSATAIEIDILLNDTINGNLLNIIIVEQPPNGSVVSSGFNLLYFPDAGFCDGIDSFTYAIQNEVGWDTATVYVEVMCSELTIYTGFSPNGDNKNDTWTILGIERFTNNTVQVFNRWGNEVYKREGYTNNDAWDGTWNSDPLPDGTYFYIVSDGEGQVLNGYVQIQR